MDPILGTKTLFLADKDPRKMNVGIGAYRTDDGKPYVLSVVRAAELAIANDKSMNHEYLSQSGHAGFRKVARDLIFGADSEVSRSDRVATVQSLSGTGALRVGAEFIHRFFGNSTVYVSDPTWGNHLKVFKNARVATKKYRYWDASKRKLDIEGYLQDIKNAPQGSIFLMHACAHNPTGVDPTQEQWRRIIDALEAGNMIAFFDTAYQGFASGDLEKDAWSIRYATQRGLPVFVAQSFAKNFGLYNERVGSFNVVASSAKHATAIVSQLNLIIRPMYSNPPVHGARIVHHVLTNPALYDEWRRELLVMSGRIQTMRKALRAELERLNTPGSWEHITTQIGMFSFTGLTVAQSEAMISRHHVYMLKNGRISMSGVNSSNVKYLAAAINNVVTTISA
eukprot:TRINITY_DN64481_c0_g2_i3.p1 TRINITY_DN64481_c0_g2~~TRINITY_DN64481_c0_g2_i3.p1  ORF type:complete len:395 (-),score=227.01 TRINITY_DN64481_c0_g2_i3:114-1298(-)